MKFKHGTRRRAAEYEKDWVQRWKYGATLLDDERQACGASLGLRMTDKQKQKYLTFAKDLALEAGEIMRRYFGKKPDAHLKADSTIVTVADEEINRLVIDRVKAVYPDHDIDGEEASDCCGSQYVWVCDPIDGTAPFAMELPVSVFSLALVIDGQPEIGVVYAPFANQLYHAVCGGGAFMNDQPIRVNEKVLERGAVMNIDWWVSAEWDVMQVAHDLACKTGVYVLSPGSTTHAAMLVARGEYVASLFPGTRGKNVDMAAAKVIIEEAGGKVTDIFGKEQRYDRNIRGAVVSNGIVHDEIIKALKEVTQ